MKQFITALLGLFNFSIFCISDQVDSLRLNMEKLRLEELELYEQLSEGIIELQFNVFLSSLRTGLMIVTTLVMFFINQKGLPSILTNYCKKIKNYYDRKKEKSKAFLVELKANFKLIKQYFFYKKNNNNND